MVKLADTPDLGSGGEIRGGSSPSSRTIIMKNTLLRNLLALLIFINYSGLQAEGYLDYSFSYVIDSCKITKQKLFPETDPKEKILNGRKKYKICMNFIMSLSTTLSERCLSANKKDITPKNSMTYADLSIVNSTQEIINEVINYSLKYPHFDNQIAWLHASKAISQKWPCKK